MKNFPAKRLYFSFEKMGELLGMSDINVPWGEVRYCEWAFRKGIPVWLGKLTLFCRFFDILLQKFFTATI